MIDFEDALHGILTLIKGGGSDVIIGAIITCIFTQLIKKIFINKSKIEIFKKFDPSVILPFIIGTICSLVLSLIEYGTLNFDILYSILVNGLTYGATATVLFKLIWNFSSTNVKKLSKDELFSVIYPQMMLLENIKSKLLSRHLSLADFIIQVKQVVDGTKGIYNTDTDDNLKKLNLIELIHSVTSEIIEDVSIEYLHSQLLLMFAKDEIISKEDQ